MKNNYETVIGLEIHVQLNTASKAFCADSAAFGAEPNSQVSAISLAYPGTLPRLNRRAVEYAVRLGLSLGCRINPRSHFDRKNYSYPDLPKGFQTTQDSQPICLGGAIPFFLQQGREATLHLHHIHLEEDAGKSLHDQHDTESLIDLNRAGVPLLEIVTEPELRSADEVAACLNELRRLVRWLGISDGNMEQGSLRCDVNVSVRPLGETRLGTRCEIKNMNSMRFARRAVEYEAARQIAILESGGKVRQETRGFDPSAGQTHALREKEEAQDYRYFPEPDLPPVVIAAGFLEAVKRSLPPLPWALEQAFQRDLGLSADDAQQIAQERETAFYFLGLQEKSDAGLNRPIANFLVQKILPWAASEQKSVTDFPLNAGQVGDFLRLIASGKISASTAHQKLLPALLDRPDQSPTLLATELQLLQSADTGWLEQLVEEALARMPDKVAEYRKGKKGLLQLFVGEVMKSSKGQADPKATRELLEDKLR